MEKKYRIVFLVSLIANLTFASAFIHHRYFRTPNDSARMQATEGYRSVSAMIGRVTSPPTQPEMPAAIQIDATELKEIFSRVRSAEVPDARAKRMLLGYLNTQNAEPVIYKYWRPASVRSAGESLARHQMNNAIRAAITEAFGSEAIEDVAFASLFRPYAREFPFLSSNKQVELERLSAERQKAFLETVGEHSGTQMRTLYQRTQAALTEELQKLLTSEELFEYQLRTSPTAQRLLESGFDFSEAEFRKVYQALAASPQSLGAEAAMIAPLQTGMPVPPAMERVKAVLGDRRFEEYAKRQDPTYGMLQALSEPYNIIASNMEAAYRTIVDSAAEVARIQRAGPILTPDASQALRSQLDQRDEKLKELLGQKGFEVASRSLPALVRNHSIPMSSRPENVQAPIFQTR